MKPDPILLDSIQRGLSDALGQTARVQWVRGLAGGDINHAALIRFADTDYFLKYHHAASDKMFSVEALALDEIASKNCIRVPSPIALGNTPATSWLVLEYLELSSTGSAALLGERLAALHEITRRHYGWGCDNFIGSTPQINTPHESWSGFWRECRIGPQLALAEAGGHGRHLQRQGQRLLERMEQLMDGHQPAASLLHGDLWAGNKAFVGGGQPVIFDPASYYGDRETDIAMTRLFGGYDADFYAAYAAHLPLADGYHLRQDLYNLYHMLNHLNLFGSGYLSRCENMIDTLLAQVR